MSPRRNPGRASAAEERVRANVRTWLDQNERTVPWLARQMTNAGCPIGQSSLWKFLNQDRALYVDEVVALSLVLKIDLDRLMSSLPADWVQGLSERDAAEARQNQRLLNWRVSPGEGSP